MSEAILRREKMPTSPHAACLYAFLSYLKKLRQWDTLSWPCDMLIVVDLEGNDHNEENESYTLHFPSKDHKDTKR